MQEIMLPDMPVEQREQVLRDSCDQIIERSYTRKFTQDEVSERKTKLAELSIELRGQMEEFQNVKAEYKAKMKPIQEKLSKTIDEIKVGSEYIHGDCFKFIDEENRVAGIYAPDGQLIEERPLTSEEKQRTLFKLMPKTGTDN